MENGCLRDTTGYTILELCITLPVILMGALAIVDVSNAFHAYNMLSEAARFAARELTIVEAPSGALSAAATSHVEQDLAPVLGAARFDCATERNCTSVIATAPTPDLVEVQVAYQLPLLVLGREPITIAATARERIELSFINRDHEIRNGHPNYSS